MRIVLAVVGRPRDAALGAAAREYEARAARYWPLVVTEVREERARAGEAPAQLLRREGERLAAQLPDGGHMVVCDERGRGMDSPAFASWLQEKRELARDITFVIGGAWGLDESVRARADTLLALGPWTLPHELARVVLAEQLYRAGTILRGEPYHK